MRLPGLSPAKRRYRHILGYQAGEDPYGRGSCLAAVRRLLRDRSRSLLLPAAALLELSGS